MGQCWVCRHPRNEACCCGEGRATRALPALALQLSVAQGEADSERARLAALAQQLEGAQAELRKAQAAAEGERSTLQLRVSRLEAEVRRRLEPGSAACVLCQLLPSARVTPNASPVLLLEAGPSLLTPPGCLW